jgi:radical SAM superfamily enzyme YgiQ (UPF0313 family)
MFSKDIVLIYLPKPFLKQPDAQAPLGLMYIAASLERKGVVVDLKNYATYSDDEAIEDLPNAKIFGITITSLEVLQASRFAKKIKSKYPDSKVLLGGPGVYASEYIDWNYIDSICIGEGEYTIFDILKDVKNGIIQKQYFGKIVEDLDNLPLPARHLLKNKQGGNIFAYNNNYIGEESTVIISTRGCPYRCSFCSAPALTYSNKVRFRNSDSVAYEMKHVIDSYGIKQFRFSDDMFTASKKNVLELCKKIERLEVVWRISCRVKPLDEDMLKAMWDAGCRELSFGIESFDDKVLAGLNKNATCEDNVKALEMANKYGYKTRILFMIRTPYQTKETISINKYWISKVPFTIMACTSFIPNPGCDIWYNPDKYNIEILDKNLDKYNFYMFGPEGRRPLDPLIKIKDRSLNEFMAESEEFRDWVDEYGKINRG